MRKSTKVLAYLKGCDQIENSLTTLTVFLSLSLQTYWKSRSFQETSKCK